MQKHFVGLKSDKMANRKSPIRCSGDEFGSCRDVKSSVSFNEDENGSSKGENQSRSVSFSGISRRISIGGSEYSTLTRYHSCSESE